MAGFTGPYVGEVVAVESDERTYAARAYLGREAERWRALVARGDADALRAYPPELAADERLKACCIRTPGHAPPHDVVDPLAG